MAKTTNIQKILITLIATILFVFLKSFNTYAADVQVEVIAVPVASTDIQYTQEELEAIYLAQQAQAAQATTPAEEIQISAIPQAAPMPTSAMLNNPANAKKVGNCAGTDQWNDMIYTHCMARGIDPVFVKAIMTVESGGNVAAKNGSYLGLYQVGKSFGYDTNKMLSDPDYQTEAAIDVIYSKIAVAYDLGCPANIYYVAKFYNGSESYAKMVSRIYEDLTDVEGSSKTNLVKIF